MTSSICPIASIREPSALIAVTASCELSLIR